MAANFELNLKINGVDTTIQTINDLESALKASKEELNGLVKGSDEFSKVASNIRKIDSELKNVKVATEGVNTKQLAKSFADLGQTVSGSFAIATSAMQLFGSESEEITQAQIKAQQALNIVLGYRAVKEGLVEGAAAARFLVDKASTVLTTAQTALTNGLSAALGIQIGATEGATVATTVLSTAMKAIPIVAVIAGIAALVGWLVDWGEEEENIGELIDQNIERIKDYESFINLLSSTAQKLAGIEVEIAKVQGKSIKEVQELQKNAYKQRGKDLEELLALNIENDKKLRELRDKALDQDDEENVKKLDKEIKDSRTRYQELLQQQKIYNAEGRLLTAQHDKEVADDKKKSHDKAVQDAKKAADDAKALDEDILKRTLEINLLKANDEIEKLSIKQEFERQYLQKKYAGQKRLNEDLAKLDEEYNLLKKVQSDKNASEDEKKRAEFISKEKEFYFKLNEDRAEIDVKGKEGRELLKAQEDKAILEAEARKLQKIQDLNDLYGEQLDDSALLKAVEGKTEAEVKIILDKQKKRATAEKQINQDLVDEKSAINSEYRNKEDQAEEAAYQKSVQRVNQYVQLQGQILSSVNNIISAVQSSRQIDLDNQLKDIQVASQAQTDSITTEYNNQLKAQEDKLAKGLISEGQYTKATKALSDKYSNDVKAQQKKLEAEQYAAKKKAFDQDKKLKKAQAIISGFQGAVAAFTGAMSLGPIAGPIVGAILAGAVAAMTAINVANIEKTTFESPSSGGAEANAPTAAGEIGGGGSSAAPTGGFTQFGPGIVNNTAASGSNVTPATGGGQQKVLVVEYNDIRNTGNRVTSAENAASF